MRYFFVSPDRVFEETLLLEDEECHHLKDVLRMKTGDRLEVSDGTDFIYQAEILKISREGALCSILKQAELPQTPQPRIVLLQSIPKGKRMDLLIQKTTEIGVHEIVPIEMHRSVRILPPEKRADTANRWRRIAREAAKQSGRNLLPRIREPVPLHKALDEVADFPLLICFDEKEEQCSLREIHERHPAPDRISVLVGPEGGLTSEERDLLSARGFVSATLGEHILRVETAGILAVGLVRYEWER